MLKTKAVYIDTSTKQADGTYKVDLFFNPVALGAYLNLGDQITDTKGKRFLIKTATLPFADGAYVYLQALDGVAPTLDSDYNSYVETPGQINEYPQLQTLGTISAAKVKAANLYQHTVTASWTNATVAQKMLAGDTILDSTGRAFNIITVPADFSTNIVVEEAEHIGAPPKTGACSLSRSTTTTGFYQGQVPTTDSAQYRQSRDFFMVDQQMAALKAAAVTRVYNKQPVETPDGTLTTFTLPNAQQMKPGSLEVAVNGIWCAPGEFSELSATQFSISLPENWIPGPDDEITLNYSLLGA